MFNSFVVFASNSSFVQKITRFVQPYFPIITSALIAKALITVMLAVASWSIGLPYFMIAAFSMGNGLPFFDVMDAARDFVAPLIGFSFVMTIFMSMVFLAPGIVKLWDPANLPALPISGFFQSDIAQYNKYRWCWSFVPALIFNCTILAYIALQQEKADDKALWWATFVGLTFCTVAISLKDMRWVAPGVLRISSDDLRARFTKKHWQQLSITNAVGSVWFWFYLPMSARFLQSKSKGMESFEFDTFYVNILIGLGVSLCAFVFFVAATAWGNKLSVGRVLGAVSFTAFFLVAVWPNGNRLIGGYLRELSHGGGKWVVFTAPTSLSTQWPELFESQAGTVDVKAEWVRSKPLQLALLGKDKIFFYIPSSEDIPAETPIVIERSKIEGIAFLAEPPKKANK